MKWPLYLLVLGAGVVAVLVWRHTTGDSPADSFVGILFVFLLQFLALTLASLFSNCRDHQKDSGSVDAQSHEDGKDGEGGGRSRVADIAAADISRNCQEE